MRVNLPIASVAGLFMVLSLAGCGGAEEKAPPSLGPAATMAPIREASERGVADAIAFRDMLKEEIEPGDHSVVIPGDRALQVARLQAAALDQMEELMRRTLDGRSGACDGNNAPLTGNPDLDALSDDLQELDGYLAHRDDNLVPAPPPPVCPPNTGCGGGGGGAGGVTPVDLHTEGTCRPGASLEKLVRKLRALSKEGDAYADRAVYGHERLTADLSEISALLLDRSITAYEIYGER